MYVDPYPYSKYGSESFTDIHRLNLELSLLATVLILKMFFRQIFSYHKCVKNYFYQIFQNYRNNVTM